jgi:esterase/lipase superfamily enzyme
MDKWNESVREKGSKDALVFVHGFNTSFQEALLRNAQMVWDLQYQGASVVFSWPSRGGTAAYLHDRDTALRARHAFRELLKQLRQQGIENISVLAHSMGNFVVLEGLGEEADSPAPVHLSELIMAAPDIDRVAFEQIVPKLRNITKGMTLYASRSDRALVLSGKLAQGFRAGDVRDGKPIVLADLDTIDVSMLGEEMLGLNHTKFAERRELMQDIKVLLATGQRPAGTRWGVLEAVQFDPAPLQFWRYRAQ